MNDPIRLQACQVLGVPADASEEVIKTAYKTLVKQYHPDMGNTVNAEYYQAVVQAYRYLKEHPAKPVGVSSMPAKILGQPAAGSRSGYSYSRGSEYAQFEKDYQRKKQEKKAAFEEHCKEEKEQQETYKRAMDAINSIRIAEALKLLIRESQEDKP